MPLEFLEELHLCFYASGILTATDHSRGVAYPRASLTSYLYQRSVGSYVDLCLRHDEDRIELYRSTSFFGGSSG